MTAWSKGLFSLGFALITLPGAAEDSLMVTPKAMNVLVGDEVRFKAKDPVKGVVPCRWLLKGPVRASIDKDGMFKATAVTRGKVAVVRIRAISLAQPEQTGESEVVVVDKQFYDLMNSQLGPGWMSSYAHTRREPLPYLAYKPGTPYEQPLGGDAGREVQAPVVVNEYDFPRLIMGLGHPYPIWPAGDQAAMTGGTEVRLYSSSQGLERYDMTGWQSLPVVPRAGLRWIQTEGLRRPPEPGQPWQSHLTSATNLVVTGVHPFAGRETPAGQDPAHLAHADGQGAKAEFCQPWGLAHGMDYDVFDREFYLIVTDPGSHVLRRVETDGTTTTLAGQPGQAGFQEGDGGAARFNKPMGIIQIPVAPERYSTFLVADSGNHAIRKVTRDGKVTLFAGQPGLPGHQDSADGPPTFNRPVALDAGFIGYDGKLIFYVADQGSNLIRAIDLDGTVTTVAGQPNSTRAVDGDRATASFQDLRAILALEEPEGLSLLVLDGCALRHVALDGTVTTWAGVADKPGYLPNWRGSLQKFKGKPCFMDPQGLVRDGNACLTRTGRTFLVADRGSRALVRVGLGAKRAALYTVAGGSPKPGTRFGLLRDGHPSMPGGPFRETFYGALDAPVSVLSSGWAGVDKYLVAAGSSLVAVVAMPGRRYRGQRALPAWFLDARSPEDREKDSSILPSLKLEGPIQAGKPVQVEVTAPTGVPEAERDRCPLVYSLEALDASGHRVDRARGEAVGNHPFKVAVTFPHPGKGRLLLRYVSEEGLGRSAWLKVQVAEAAAAAPKDGQ